MPDSTNPLLDPALRSHAPGKHPARLPFHRIRPEHVAPGVREVLVRARSAVEEVAGSDGSPTWENTIDPLDRIVEEVRLATTPVQHLLSVAESKELREAWNEVLPEVSRFWSWLSLHEGLWNRLKTLADTDEAQSLEGLRRRHLERTVRDFRRAGADLPPEERDRLEAIDVELAEIAQRFSENVLDATAAYTFLVEDPDRMAGIPQDARDRFRRRAREEEKDGWLLTLDQPSFEAVLKHAEDRDLRAELHRAFLARGREEPWDNQPLIPRIMELRREKATLLGYPDFPDFRLEEHMVGSGAEARGFVSELTEKTRPYWERDRAELEEHARHLGIDPLEPWDVSFVAERLRRHRFQLDEEELRPYFPLDSVMEGLFELTHRLFGLRIEEHEEEKTWHPDVRYYHLYDGEGTLLGGFYADFFPRPEKRQGAWMNDFIYGGPRNGGGFTPHLGVICMNFPPPGEDRPALLTHRDVETLFHEFGHLLHHLTSRVPIARRGGINVAWDWVELPSQLLENWTWEREALDLFARHYETGNPLPDELFGRMLRARRFLGGWRQMRQLGFATLDLALHTEYDPKRDGDPVRWVTSLLESFSPNERFAAAHPLPSFLHIFAGGYAASYYSYLWSEVLEADLFTRFQENGIFDRSTGHRYMETILSAGDRDDPQHLFRSFMGRDPDPEALVTRNLGEAA